MALGPGKKARLPVATTSTDKPGRKRSKDAVSTSPEQPPKKQKPHVKKSRSAADNTTKKKDEAKPKNVYKYMSPHIGSHGYVDIGQVQDNTQKFECPIKGCETAIHTKRDFREHMRLGPDDKRANKQKGHGISSASFKNH